MKFGIYFNTMFNEYEHYIGHLVDTSPTPAPGWQVYEIPINLMINSRVDS